ncbi:MAG: hypothetical protein KDB92_02570, partial [Chitinophagaceae bacterium]|nr:hypothetical protein [Chitinophagaceae bacterium]
MFNFSKTKPFTRQHVVEAVNYYLQKPGIHLSKVDRYNIDRLYMNNLEYVPEANRFKYKSKRKFIKHFYATPANLFEVHAKDFDLVINPVVQYTISKEQNNSDKLFLNTRGVTLRGKIANKIGFYTYLTDNQERA